MTRPSTTEPATGLALIPGTAGWAAAPAGPARLHAGDAGYIARLAGEAGADADLDFLCEGRAGRLGLVQVVGGLVVGSGLTRRQAVQLSEFLATLAAALPADD